MSTEQTNELNHILEPHHMNAEFWHKLYINVSIRSTEYAGLLGKSVATIEAMIPLITDSDQRKYFEDLLLQIRRTLSDIGINAE
jgi:hypothetical protein